MVRASLLISKARCELTVTCVDPNQYYHVSCIERILGDLTTLIHTGDLKVNGRFHQAIEDWFSYGGRTFDVRCYDAYNQAHKTWVSAWSTKEIEHQLGHSKSEGDCELCRSWPVPEEPMRGDYFLQEPSACLLSKVLADVAGVQNIDALSRRPSGAVTATET
jgi:hypothetical protein